MRRILLFLAVSIFAIFVGSQITEGFLLVPYWKTLPTTEFYDYYALFGPTIGRFYTVLTIIAVLIPVGLSVYSLWTQSPAFKYSIASTLFAGLFLTLFYVYFKDVNQQFYEAAFSTNELKLELESWAYWHWARVLMELASLIFIILAAAILSENKSSIVA